MSRQRICLLVSLPVTGSPQNRDPSFGFPTEASSISLLVECLSASSIFHARPPSFRLGLPSFKSFRDTYSLMVGTSGYAELPHALVLFYTPWVDVDSIAGGVKWVIFLMYIHPTFCNYRIGWVQLFFWIIQILWSAVCSPNIFPWMNLALPAERK